MQDDDLSFAQWVIANDGEIGILELYSEGETVHITKGPLKVLKDKIRRIDKRNRNALILLGFDRKNFKGWLAFEWMNRMENTF